MGRPTKASAIAAAREHLEGGKTPGDFQLAGADFSNFRRAIERDDADEAGMGAHVAKFWEDAGARMGFDPRTICAIGKPDVEPIKFLAEAVDPAAKTDFHVVKIEPGPEIVDDDPLGLGPVDMVEGPAIDNDRYDEHFSELTDAMAAQADNFVNKRGSLSDRMRDTMIDCIKHRPKPWSQCSSAEQKDTAHAIEQACVSVLKQAVIELAANDRPHIRAQLDKTSNDGGKVKGNVSFYVPDDSIALALFHATGKQVIIILADAEEETTGRHEPPIEADEPELGFASDAPAGPADNSDLAGDVGRTAADDFAKDEAFRKAKEAADAAKANDAADFERTDGFDD